jgi:alpha-1,3-rhamnosyl/mannosyltransferase
MQVGFDATNILGHGGIKTYARELLKGLAGEFPSDSFQLLTTFNSSKVDRIRRLFEDCTNITVKPALPHVRMLGRGLYPLTRLAARILWKRAARCLDVTHLTDPFGAAMIPDGTVSTVHDLFPLTRREYSKTRLQKLYRITSPQLLRRSGAVITPSKYIRDQLLGLYPGCTAPVFAVPEAASDVFRPEGRSSCTELPGGLEPGRFFLFVGGVDPRKNIPFLVTAYRELSVSIRGSYPLVLVLSGDRTAGTAGPGAGLEELTAGSSTMVLRDVNDTLLAALYRNATAFVFPSLDEGFGLPVLEAMSSGCPVITSSRSCLPEVAGDAALLVDPTTVGELTRTMEMLAESFEVRAEYGDRGLSRSREFSWARTARETMAVYRTLAS